MRQAASDKVTGLIEGILKAAATFRQDYPPPHQCLHECPYPEKRLQYLIDKFMSSKIWPGLERNGQPLSAVLCALRSIELPDAELQVIPGAQHTASCPRRTFEGSFGHVRLGLTIAANLVEQRMARLCYDCVREGKVLGPDCRHASAEKG